MSTDLVIARLGSALVALGEAKTIQDTKAILDVATAASIYAKRQKLSEENIAFANEVKFEAMRQLGELLREAPKNTGAQGIGKSAVPDRNRTPTLADQGIDKKTSMTAQKLADLPPEKFQAVKSGEMSLSKATAKPKILEPDDDILEPASKPEPDDADKEQAEDDSADDASAAITALYEIAEDNEPLKKALETVDRQAIQIKHLTKENDRLMGELAKARGQVNYWKNQVPKK